METTEFKLEQIRKELKDLGYIGLLWCVGDVQQIAKDEMGELVPYDVAFEILQDVECNYTSGDCVHDLITSYIGSYIQGYAY